MRKINITASKIDEFKKIEDLLKTLPEDVSSQISSAKMGGVGVECIIMDDNSENQKIYIPNNVTKITRLGYKENEFIAIYCDEFLFTLTGNLAKKECTYIFVNYEK